MAEMKHTADFEKDVLDAIPRNWCDPLLTGPNKVLPEGYSYTPADIERLLNAIRERVSVAISAALTEPAQGTSVEAMISDEQINRAATFIWENGVMPSMKYAEGLARNILEAALPLPVSEEGSGKRDAVIAAGNKLYSAIAEMSNHHLTTRCREAMCDYADASNAMLKSTKHEGDGE